MESQSVELRLLPSGVETENRVGGCSPAVDQFSKAGSVSPVTHGKGNRPATHLDCEDETEWRKDDGTIKESEHSDTFHVLSCSYAKILVAISAVLIFTELLHGPVPLLFFHGYLFTYLVGGGIICFIGVYVSILADKWSHCPGEENKSLSTNKAFIKHYFNSEIGLYLRIGAVVFGLGTLLSCVLEILSIFTMQYSCMDELNLAQPVLRCLFSSLQLHFLFMDVKVISHFLGIFRHAALMHLLAVNTAIGVKLMLWKTAEDWLDAVHVKRNSSQAWPSKEFALSLHTMESDSSDASKQGSLHKIYFTTNCWWRRPKEEEMEDLLELRLCLQNSTAGSLWEKSMEYLYPFILQYCLAAAGIIYAMWSSLSRSHYSSYSSTSTSSHSGKSHIRSRMCFTQSSKGLTLGLVIFVAGVVLVVLFFVPTVESHAALGIATLRCVILVLATLFPVMGLLQIKKMKTKVLQRTALTEFLQNIGILAVYIFGCFNVVIGAMGIDASDSSTHLLLFLDGGLMVLQACLQSLFIHQIIKKGWELSEKDGKPVRNIAIFLVFCNAVLWLLDYFSMNSYMLGLHQRQFYGEILWSVIVRIFLPLVMFYRFHSAVTLIEVWHRSYRNGNN